MAGSNKGGKLDHYECDGQMSIFDCMTPAQEYAFETGKNTYWQDSQGKPYQWWKEEEKVCNFSGHTCNKNELWKIADSLDEIQCPHVCCRKCNTKLCGARCNGSEEPKKRSTRIGSDDDYIKDHPTCFYVLGHYLDREQGWHKMPEELPNFTTWQLVDVVLYGKKTGTPWMEHEKWEAKDWAFRSVDDRRNTETTDILAWKLSDKEKS